MLTTRPGIVASATTMAVLALLAGCTQTLPAPEAGAFRTMATLGRDDFARRVGGEYQALVADAALELRANRGRVTVGGCEPQDQGDCVVTYTDDTLRSVPLVGAAPNARVLIGGIATYATRMADLAEAKDLDELRAKAEAAGGSAKALALVALPTGPLAGMVAPLIDAAFWAANASRVDHRRRALLRIATATQPAIDSAADTLNTMTGLLRETPIEHVASRLNATKDAITISQVQERALRLRAAQMRSAVAAARLMARADDLRDRRDADFETLMAQRADLNMLRTPAMDYRTLAEAHRTLIDKLANPHVSIENAMRDLDLMVATAGAALPKPANSAGA